MTQFDLTGATRGAPLVVANDDSTDSSSAAMLRSMIAPARFNNLCRWAAVVYLLATTVPVAIFRNIPGGWVVDFPQYYMAGTVALHGDWDALYPIPNSNSLYNPGDKDSSTMNSRYAQLAAQR